MSFTAAKLDPILAKVVRANSDNMDTHYSVLTRISEGDFLIPTDVMIDSHHDEETLMTKISGRARRYLSKHGRPEWN